MNWMLLLLAFLPKTQDARRAQVYFYDSQKQPIALQYFWIDTDDTEKEYAPNLMQHSIKQHQDFVLKHKSLQIVFQRKNGDFGSLGLNVKQPGRFNVIVKDAVYMKCRENCVAFKATVLPDVTVEAP